MHILYMTGKLGAMKSSKATLVALHLFLIWVLMAFAAPILGLALLGIAWDGGAAAFMVLLVMLAVVLGLLNLIGLLVDGVVPLSGSAPRRLSWSVLVLVLGSLGLYAGATLLGRVGPSGGFVSIARAGLPYALAAALLVPNRWPRLRSAGRTS